MISDNDLEARISKSMNMKIIMTAIPEMGHFTPLMRLGKYLGDKGHEIHFVTFAYHK